MTRVRHDRRGAVLLTVILLVLLLLVAIAGAFTRTSAERRTAMDATAQVDAFAIAKSGIDLYINNVTTMPATLPDSQTYTMTGGRAVVTLRRIYANASGDTLLVLIARGENTTNRYAANANRAIRTVAQMVKRSSGTLNVKAGFVSLTGFTKNGNSGSISGEDHCSATPDTTIYGIAVPATNTSPYNTADYSGHTNPIDGNPDNTPFNLGQPGRGNAAVNSIDMDWQGIVQRTSLTPDYYYKTTAPTSGSWPGATALGGANFPVTFVEGNLTLPGDGQGILIVTGNITISGSDTWNGILLVGGNLTSNGNNKVYGATYTGLNLKLPVGMINGTSLPEPTAQSLGNGNKTYQYDSCNIKKSLSRFGGWTRLGNAYTDTWPVY